MADFPYVLKVGSGNTSLVKILYVWFDQLGIAPPDKVKNWQALGGKFTEQTKQSVIQYQMLRGITPADGIVRALMWSEMGKQIGYKTFDHKLYECIYEAGSGCNPQDFEFLKKLGYTDNALTGGVKVYKPLFIEMYFREFAGVPKETFDGLSQFLDFMSGDKNITDMRYAAYMLATSYHEAKHKWRPIDEDGKGAGKDYGKTRTGRCGGKEYKNIYYGRGYVQITWEDNYEKADKFFDLKCTLVANPERAKEPEIAYKIMSQGMTDGWFEKKHNYKMADFINDKTTDYLNARKVVNGLDQASLIEGYTKTFEGLLRAAIIR